MSAAEPFNARPARASLGEAPDWRGYPPAAPQGDPVRYCTHCGELGTDARPVESVGEAGESGGGSTVFAHPGCGPKPRPVSPSHTLRPRRGGKRT